METIINKYIPEIFKLIHAEMLVNRDYLIELDSVSGDGDLGISMCQGFGGVLEELSKLDVYEMEPKKIILKAAMAINEHSPSSLGTILCAGMMGGAKAIGLKQELGAEEYRDFVKGAMEGIMARAGSKRGEKTILDAIGGALDALEQSVQNGDSLEAAAKAAAKGAADGMESTRAMVAVHGRAAYYREKSIGNVDGGATVGMLIFKAISAFINGEQ